jgi:DNA modification methylase
MFVFYAEQILPIEKKTGVLDLLDKGEISIHKAYKLLKGKKEKIAKSEARKLAMIEGQNTDVWYQLYNKSSMIMNEIEDNSVDMCIDSHPYFQLREYRNQDELSHGQEKTVKEYVDNFVKFCQEKRKKLKPGGVLVTILGETYREGYQLVCSRVEVALADDGWEPVDCNIWEKLNGKYTPHPLRFVNAYERIIVVRKPGGETHFEEIMRESSTDGYEIKKTSSGGYYMASPESCITNVIKSSVHNPSEFKEVDDQFQHDAPCPIEIYRKFLMAYSKPGQTILDGFVGSGSVGIGLTLGRNIIGFDVDPESIEFCQKRFEKFIEDKQNQLQLAA